MDDEKTAGRASLVADMLDQGTADHTAAAIARYFDSIGGRLSFGSGRFTVFGEATTLREDFPQAAAVFAECFLRPTFPAGQFAKIQGLALGAIADRTADPEAEIAEVFADHLPAASPYHLVTEGKAESVRALTRLDLARFHNKYFVPKHMVVTIFGDIEPDRAVALAGKLFGGSYPAAAPKIDFRRPNALAGVRRLSQANRQGHRHDPAGLPLRKHLPTEGPRRHDRADGRDVGLRLSGRVAAQRAPARRAWSTTCRPCP